MRKRGVWVEPLFGEVKEFHRSRRFRLRGLKKVNIEWMLIAVGQNLKRLNKVPPQQVFVSGFQAVVPDRFRKNFYFFNSLNSCTTHIAKALAAMVCPISFYSKGTWGLIGRQQTIFPFIWNTLHFQQEFSRNLLHRLYFLLNPFPK